LKTEALTKGDQCKTAASLKLLSISGEPTGKNGKQKLIRECNKVLMVGKIQSDQTNNLWFLETKVISQFLRAAKSDAYISFLQIFQG